MLELVFSVLLPAVGSAILFNLQGSTGGTDIVAMIFRKYTDLDIGKALFCTDFLIATLAGVVFGIETGLFSLLGLLAKALVVDSVIENIHLSKYFTIVTTKPERITRFINEELNRSATVLTGEGAYTQEGRKVLLTVLGRGQAVRPARLPARGRPAGLCRHHQHERNHRQGVPSDALTRPVRQFPARRAKIGVQEHAPRTQNSGGSPWRSRS